MFDSSNDFQKVSILDLKTSRDGEYLTHIQLLLKFFWFRVTVFILSPQDYGAT